MTMLDKGNGDREAAGGATPEAEDAELAELYAAALAEGGDLDLYDGGDSNAEYDEVIDRFQTRFPGLRINRLIDLSKYHGTRIDLEIAAGERRCDLARLQTLHDFARWKREGRLLRYQPLGWDTIPPAYKDPDGFFVGTRVISFCNVVNTDVIPLAEAPRDPQDYLDPGLRGKLAFAYPTDDDAVLFAFKLVLDRTGLDYLAALMRQEPVFVRGIGNLLGLLATGTRAASFAAPWSPVPSTAGLAWLPPRHGAFMSWGQTSAIFRHARHPVAAKLFVSWTLSLAEQANNPMWSVRRDLPARPGPYGDVSTLDTEPAAFTRFMADRAGVERLRLQLEYFVGTPREPNPASRALTRQEPVTTSQAAR